MPAEFWVAIVAALFTALLIGALGVGASAFKPLRRWPAGVGGVLFACVLFAYCTGGLSAADHYRSGVAAQQAGNPEAALSEFSAAGNYADAAERAAQLQQTVDHLRADYVQAQAAIRRRDWTEAETVLNPLAAQYPHFRDASQLRNRVDQEVTRQNLAAMATVGATSSSVPARLPLASAGTAAADATPPSAVATPSSQISRPSESSTSVASPTPVPTVFPGVVNEPSPTSGRPSNGGVVPTETPDDLLPVPAVTTTPTVSPTPTPGPTALTGAADVLALLRQQGLPIANQSTDPAITDPDGQLGRAGRFTSKVNFSDSRLPVSGAPLALTNGGAIEFYANAGDAIRRLRELARINAVIPTAAEYDYQSGRMLLRLSSRFTADQARGYDAALKGLAATAP